VQRKRQDNRFTILILPHNTRPAVSLKIPLWSVQLFVLLIIATLVGGLVATVRYREMAAVVGQVDELLVENRSQQDQILYLAERAQQLEEEARKVQELDASVRQLLKMAPRASVVGDEEQLLSATANGEPAELLSSRGGLAATILRASVSLDALAGEFQDSKASLSTLEQAIITKQARQAATPAIWPVGYRTISSGYGSRPSPFGRGREYHSGLDIGAPYGTPIYATADGVVQTASYSGGYGNMVLIYHGYGFTTLYGHMSRMAVKRGQSVKRGQIIGYVGSTGRSTGPHVHYEVRVYGNPVSPFRYLP
jgi:murein DD-endopeptidase MepM/ murein hydrolase activator NlpD